MGLTGRSTWLGALGGDALPRQEGKTVVALAGNPNVGKSTVFNALTGMDQHTGNWPGKTVCSAQGSFSTAERSYLLVDIPGTYSLMARSAEEEVARDFLCFSRPDAAVVVCDATCLERNLNLALQILETGVRTVICVNLMDEARRKHIHVDLPGLSRRLGVPVVGVTARKKGSLNTLTRALDEVCSSPPPEGFSVPYPPVLEGALALLEPSLRGRCRELDSRWVALKLLQGDETLLSRLEAHLGPELFREKGLQNSLNTARTYLAGEGIGGDALEELTVSALIRAAQDLCGGTVRCDGPRYDRLDRKLDRIFTSRLAGYPVMIALLGLIFYITIVGANYPSALLSAGIGHVQDWLTALFFRWGAPEWLHGLVVLGAFQVLGWVVSVMLPPMAIFFPLFTLLEDAGYLPRVAYNLDRPFRRCGSCGKQALCMCMGFGCNAAGVVGCRIIDSPRERLLAILTNSFVPCNGRFPALITILTMFFAGAVGGIGGSVLSAALLTGVIVLGVGTTFAATKLLCATLLKGEPSSFVLELPPYRPPQVGKVILRSIFDRTLFVLGRAAAVAAPAGALIWLMANVTVGGSSILVRCAAFLDPLGRFMGLDGTILTAFVLGFPANEIVIPILVMAYTQQGSLGAALGLGQMRLLFEANGWTWVTAVCMVLFFLNHWPCSTTLLTIHRETGSLKWTAVAAALPTLVGFLLCALVSHAARLL